MENNISIDNMNKMQKIALISDIHGNIAALEKVVEDFTSRNVDCVFNLGDHVSGPLYPRETLAFLSKQNWIQILGNHDRQLIQQNPAHLGSSDLYAYTQLSESDLEWLRSLPASCTIENQFQLFHGTPKNDAAYLLETVEHGTARLAAPNEIIQRLSGLEPQIIVCGHSHIPRYVKIPGNVLLVNPGSVGMQAYADDQPEYHVIENGSPHARYAILEYRHNSWQVEIIAVAYDYQKAAARAGKNGRADWEFALQTGYVLRK